MSVSVFASLVDDDSTPAHKININYGQKLQCRMYSRHSHTIILTKQHLSCGNLGYETIVEYLRCRYSTTTDSGERTEQRKINGHSLFCKQFSKMQN